MTFKVAYRCLRCLLRWSAVAAPQTCPACSHKYVEWSNYEERVKAGKPR